MGRPVLPHQPRPVDGKAHGQTLQRHVMHDLVIAPLQEGRIDRADRTQARCRHRRRHRDRMLLGNPHIEHAGRKAPCHDVQSRPRWHGGGDRHHARITGGLFRQRIAKDIGIGGRIGLGLRLFPRQRVELRHAVIFVRRILGRRKALALHRHRMDQHRPRRPRPRGAQGLQHLPHVMPVDGSDIGKAQLLKQSAAPRHPRHQLPRPPRAVAHGPGQMALELLCRRLEQRQRPLGRNLVEVFRQGPHRRCDAHVIVVQDDEQPLAQMARMVHRLIGHARRDRPVADDGDGIPHGHPHVAPDGKPQRGRNRRGRMRRPKGVVLAL